MAQEQTKDSIPVKTERYGVRVGVDLFKIGKSVFEDGYQGIELVGDYRLTKNYYLAGELGNENRTVQEDRLNFTTKGTYFKVGFDYNVYENWLDMENLVYVGFRIGVSSHSQELNTYKVYNRNPYLGEAPDVISGAKFDGLSAQWGEFILGVKAELFSNVYAGFSARIHFLVNETELDGFENLYIPGFNKTYGGSFGVGFNYTISYFIPIYKKKIEPKIAKP
jgi:hypothetical protein